MSFKDRVEDLISSTITDTAEATQFLQDGVVDVISKVLKVNPADARLFETSETFSSASSSAIDSGAILSVARENGVANAEEPATQIDPSERYRAEDLDSLSYRSKFNPGWYLLDNKVHVIPTPNASNEKAVIRYVGYPTPDITDSSIGIAHHRITNATTTGGATPCVFASVGHGFSVGDVVEFSNFSEYTNINGVRAIIDSASFTVDAFTCTGISSHSLPSETTGGTVTRVGSGFPEQYEYLACMYVAMRKLQADMAGHTVPFPMSFNSVPVPIGSIDAPSFSYSASGYNLITSIAGIAGTTAPVYTAPSNFTLTTYAGYTNTLPKLEIISAVPVPPNPPSFTYPDADSAAGSTGLANNIYLGSWTSAPAPVPVYTPPFVESDGSNGESPDLTHGAHIGDLGEPTDFPDFDSWWKIAGYLIEDEEDPELAGVHIQKINSYLTAYREQSAANWNEFQADLKKYEAYIDNLKTTSTLELQRKIEHTKLEAQVNLQNAASNYKADLEQYQEAVKIYGTEVMAYEKETSTQIQEYTQNLQRSIKTWELEQAQKVQSYDVQVKNSIADFNRDVSEYQAEVQKRTAEHQAVLQIASKDQDHKFAIDQQNKAKELERQVSEYTASLEKYKADVATYGGEIQSYTAVAQKEIGEFSAQLQETQMQYSWKQDQYARLKAEYNEAFSLMAPPKQRKESD